MPNAVLDKKAVKVAAEAISNPKIVFVAKNKHKGCYSLHRGSIKAQPQVLICLLYFSMH